MNQRNLPTFENPQPSGMTFFLVRVRLAQICREITDSIPLESYELIAMPYETIVALNRKFEDFFNSLPCFFQSDPANQERRRVFETIYPKLPLMRYYTLAAAHTKRLRLHQKYLLRQDSDPRYVYSRQACLESARAVILLLRGPQAEIRFPCMSRSRLGMAVHFTHLALVVLVMDLCFNKDKAGELGRKLEIRAVLDVLEGTTSISPLVSRSLESINQVLRKHQVRLPPPAAAQIGGDGFDIIVKPSENAADPERSNDSETALDTDMEDLWRSIAENEFALDSIGWDNLFSDLDSRPL